MPTYNYKTHHNGTYSAAGIPHIVPVCLPVCHSAHLFIQGILPCQIATLNAVHYFTTSIVPGTEQTVDKSLLNEMKSTKAK